MSEIMLPRIGRSFYVALGRDDQGWWRQDEPDGAKMYGSDVEAMVRSVLPQWMIDEAEGLPEL